VTLTPIDNSTDDFPHPVPHIYFQAMVQIILAKADEIMNEAKKNGRNCYHFEEPVPWTGFTDAVGRFSMNKDFIT